MQKRRYPIGAELSPGGAHFRVWAPAARKGVEVVLEEGPGAPAAVPLAPEPGGYHSAHVPGAGAGTHYRFRVDGEGIYPDPASRFQPDGPHGCSRVVDPRGFRWNDSGWKGLPLEGQALYEMHIGTFTHDGTYEAAARELPELASCGVTVLEIMPVSDFPGRFGWGYDGVGMFAPTWLYGEPDHFRHFVDEAHRHSLAVILDVVYNHLGPDGNYLHRFSSDYFTSRYQNEWGEAINFDGPESGPAREFFLTNAAYWIEEFHLDGLRLDATQQIFDSSAEHIVAAICKRVRKAARGRETIIIAENEPQDTTLARPVEKGGYGVDGLWNDDYHHSAMVALTGHNEAYYTDYLGKPQEFISAAKYGYLYQGQFYSWQKKRRGKPSFGLRPEQFVNFIQNHDQIANSGRGERIHALASPGRYRAVTALTLLMPGAPMLFQGQEFGASTPFYYFADQAPELGRKVRQGRIEFLRQFRTLASPEMQECFTDPGNPSTFQRSKLDFLDRERNAGTYQMHKDLLRLRREDPVLRAPRAGTVDGAVLGPDAFLLRWFGGERGDRLLLVNLGVDLHPNPAPEPLLAPPFGARWRIAWSSEHPRYGGCGTAQPDTPEENWRIPGHAALLLAPESPESPHDQ